MIDLKIDPRLIDDLHDDFVINTELTLYEFLGKDPVKAFYLGLNFSKWFETLDKEQKYLYSKQIRHNIDDLEKYQTQIKYWSDQFSNKKDDVPMVELSEYIINNMFWDSKTEDLDRVKLALFFGLTIDTKRNEQKSEDIH